jgi:hypothetical protein
MVFTPLQIITPEMATRLISRMAEENNYIAFNILSLASV